jgi:predicted MFS family arabinose efflux permease
MDNASPAPPGRSYVRYVLFTLLAVYMVHHLDRMVIALLLEPIGREFGLSDTQRGLLAGAGYAIPFAIAGIPLGMLIDRVNRVRLLAALLCVWSALTALCATASGFWWLLAARIGVGAAESGGTPANVSIISDTVPASRRSAAFGIYYMGPHLGTIIGFAVAGAVAAAYGWRAAFLVVGIPGVLLALLVSRTIREPQRSTDAPADIKASPAAAPPLSEILRTIWHNGAALHLIVGATLINVVAAGLFSWLAPFMIRAHGLTVRDVGFAIAFGMAPFAAAGSLCGGALADRLGGFRSPRVALMLAAAAMTTVPAVLIALTTPSTAVLIGALAIQQFAHAATIGPSYASVMGLLPARMRGASAALLQVASNVLGFGVGVQVVGLLSDALRAPFGADSLRYTMLGFSLINLWTAVHFIVAARRLPSSSIDGAAYVGVDGSGAADVVLLADLSIARDVVEQGGPEAPAGTALPVVDGDLIARNDSAPTAVK